MFPQSTLISYHTETLVKTEVGCTVHCHLKYHIKQMDKIATQCQFGYYETKEKKSKNWSRVEEHIHFKTYFAEVMILVVQHIEMMFLWMTTQLIQMMWKFMVPPIMMRIFLNSIQFMKGLALKLKILMLSKQKWFKWNQQLLSFLIVLNFYQKKHETIHFLMLNSFLAISKNCTSNIGLSDWKSSLWNENLENPEPRLYSSWNLFSWGKPDFRQVFLPFTFTGKYSKTVFLTYLGFIKFYCTSL